MASATTKLPFTFNLITPHHSPKPKPHHLSFPKTLSISHKNPILKFTPKSIDVSKEDKPTSEQPISEQPISEEPISEFAPPEPQKKRPEEKFAVLNTGIYECQSCGYLYNQSVGDPSYPIPPGLPLEKLPEDWRCATCGAAKSFFVSKSVEIAGFAENQQYGLGGNTLTSGQKALLIYGGLLLGFVLFLSGYFIQ
ncbi:hypothetical protein LguiA_018891 [Lonicera macranthoides]